MPTTSTDAEGMLGKKLAIYPGTGRKDNGDWGGKTAYNGQINDKVVPFMEYANKTDRHNPGSYDCGWDWEGPLFWAPSQCMKTFDWARPKKSSPIIGIIGNTTNITDSVEDFYMALKR